jgi:hypothetical protein
LSEQTTTTPLQLAPHTEHQSDFDASTIWTSTYSMSGVKRLKSNHRINTALRHELEMLSDLNGHVFNGGEIHARKPILIDGIE